MNTPRPCEAFLTCLGLTALSAYVLACTSFSPDDSQVLFPAFDPKSGDIGASLYHRDTGQIEPVFVVSRFQEPGGAKRQPVHLRPQWMADGKRILVAWPGYSDNDDDVMNVALLAPGGKGPARFFAIPGIEDARQHLMLPLAVAGPRLFLAASPNFVVRVNLETGESTTNSLAVTDAILLPGPLGQAIYYCGKSSGAEGGLVVGRLDPDTLAQTVLWRIKEDRSNDEHTFAVGPDGRRFALLQLKPDQITINLFKGREPDKTLTVPLGGEKLNLGIPSFSPEADALYASFASEKSAGGKVVYGLLEISLQDGSSRRHPLLEGSDDSDEGGLATFTVSVSHDGKTAALCSTYLAANSEKAPKPEHCALFLVDLSNPDRKVTRLPLPLPPKTAREEKKS